MNSKKLILFVTIMFFFMLLSTTFAVNYIKSPPLSQTINKSVQNVKSSNIVQLPVITWGGDIATILANGNSKTTSNNSIFAKKDLNFKIVRQDIFQKQVEAYISGETPFLRGTMGMINMAIDVLSKDPRTKPIIIYQMTWSNGGDCLVVKSNIKSVKDLKNKTIALQAYGPHVDYLAKVLKDAGLSMKDVNIKWTKDLTGTDQTPVEAFYEDDIDAAMMIIPDALMLTSNGTVGTGAEGSVRGAKIMLSTITANRVNPDLYAVRNDYFQANKNEIHDFVHGLMLAEEQLKELFKNKNSRTNEYKSMLKSCAKILLDSEQATSDAEALYGDCEYVGFRGNVKFFGDEKWPRNMERLTNEIQSSFIVAGLLSKQTPLDQAKWDYDSFRVGLTGIDDIKAPKFKKDAVAKVIAKKQALGTLADGELFRFEINFQPNQKTFSESLYADGYNKVIELASTYGGAIITVEGHSDPHKYNKLKKNNAEQIILTRTKQAAKNLSMNRSLTVRNSIKQYASTKGLPLDDSQFTVVGHGISQPKYADPRTKEQWLSNMRVVFRIIQIEAEESVFEPLD